MRSIETENAKAYLNGLFTEERYDSFYLYEARIKAGLDYYISGKKNSAYMIFKVTGHHRAAALLTEKGFRMVDQDELSEL